MSMFGARAGSWWLSSESDPRWNCGGRTERLIVTAGLHPDALAEIERLKVSLRSEPPEDLEYGCMKD